MKPWIIASILAAGAAPLFPTAAHADATQPAPATRPSDDAMLDPLGQIPLNLGQLNQARVNQFNQAQRDLRQLQSIPRPTQIPSMTTPYKDPWSWGLLMVPTPSTRPMQSFQFNGITVYIEPLSANR